MRDTQYLFLLPDGRWHLFTEPELADIFTRKGTRLGGTYKSLSVVWMDGCWRVLDGCHRRLAKTFATPQSALDFVRHGHWSMEYCGGRC